MASTALLATVLVVVLAAGGLSYYVFSSSGTSRSQTGTSTTSTSSSVGLCCTSTTTTASSSSSVASSSSRDSSTSTTTTSGPTSSTTSTSSGSTFVLPKGGSQIVIPEGIQNANAKAENITFDPFDLKVVVGTNNTVYFVDSDLQDNLGHVIESNSWPTSSQPFAFDILPGQVMNVTLTTPGTYTYNCEWHPVWMTGTITVLPGSGS